MCSCGSPVISMIAAPTFSATAATSRPSGRTVSIRAKSMCNVRKIVCASSTVLAELTGYSVLSIVRRAFRTNGSSSTSRMWIPLAICPPPSVSPAGRSTLDANHGLGASDNNGWLDSPGCSLCSDHCSTYIGFGSRRQHDIPVFGARSDYDISRTIIEFADDQPQAVARGGHLPVRICVPVPLL